jgi:hypothetical protein
VLTQVVPHSVLPAVGHAQEPLWQVCGDVQTLPQVPQLLALVAVLTQVPLHSVGVAVGQVQTPFVQD